VIQATFSKKTVPDVANKVGDGFEEVGGQIGGGMKKVGSALEKAAPLIADGVGAALLATGYGAPLAGSVIAAGNSASVVGRQIKNSGKTVRSQSSKFGGDIKGEATGFANRANPLVQRKINNASSGIANSVNGMELAVKGQPIQPAGTPTSFT